MESDFSLLYSELGLQPDCSVDEFKRAYRRRIGELHPDRAESPDTDKLLAELLALCGSALRFHRRYGRLPGQLPQAFELPPSRTDAYVNPAPIMLKPDKPPAIEPMPARTMLARESHADKSARRTILAAAVFIILLLLLMTIWDDSPADQSDLGSKAAWSTH